MANYKHATDNPDAIIRKSDGATIPKDPANRDYAEFLKSGEVADAADPAPVKPRDFVRELAEHIAAKPARFDTLKQLLP